MADHFATDILTVHFGEVRPNDVEVREQPATFLRAHWLNQWPGIPVERPEVLSGGETRIRVTRQDLFDAARVVETERDAVDLFVRVAGWGSGTSARAIARTAKVLREGGASRALLESAKAAREMDPVDAYRMLNHRGEYKMKGFGPAFFTKWMYFNGYEQSTSRGVRPLILDKRVATSLGWKKKTGWFTSEYGEYLEEVEEVRRQWAPDVEPHVIEYALFKAGGKTRVT
jgi:hypothetical protein